MTTQTFTPAKKPSIGSGANHEAAILEAKFGEGYSQRAGDGINNIRSDFPLVWTNASPSEAENIVSFFRARGGHESFWYTLPGYDDPWLFVCKKWSDPWATGNRYNVSATLERVFDVVV